MFLWKAFPESQQVTYMYISVKIDALLYEPLPNQAQHRITVFVLEK